MFFQEALVNIFVFPVIYSHGTASGVRFIKPCQFAATSQRYRFCSWSGLVPPQQGKIIQNAERPPSSRNSGRSGRLACGGLGNGAPGSRSPGCGGVKGTGGRRLQVTPRCSPHGSVGCRQAHGPRGTRMLLVLCIPSLRPVPTPAVWRVVTVSQSRGALATPSGSQIRNGCSQLSSLLLQPPETGHSFQLAGVPAGPRTSLRKGSLGPSAR